MIHPPGDLETNIRDALAGADEHEWPARGLGALTHAKVWANSVAARFGGASATPVARLKAYEQVAAGSLSLALILTQHDAACELLGDCDNEPLASALLPRCARGEVLLTVGISQLTTSRQGHGPAMRATRDGDEFRLHGVMPWVTSGDRAGFVVTGAALDDGSQILACVPTNSAGVEIAPPFDLMALRSSRTCAVRCEDVRVSHRELMRGPMPNVLARRAPVKGITVSSVGLGVARAIIDACRDDSETLSETNQLLDERIETRWHDVRSRLYAAAASAGDPEAGTSTTAIRADVDALLARLAPTLMTLAKGSGYVTGHSAERLVREAMFFMVWSATNDVRAETLARLWGDEPMGEQPR